MLFRFFSKTIVVFMIVCSGCATSIATKPSPPLYSKFTCENLEHFISQSGDNAIPVTFRNRRADPINIYWINYSGEEELKATVSSGKQWSVNTFLTHPWVVRDNAQNCIAIYDTSPRFIVDIM